MRCRLTRDYRFEAAHFLPRVPAGHKCRRVHGHSYEVRVSLLAEVDPERGWIMDFAEVDEVVDPVVARLDHQLLNEVEGLENPTAEHLAIWLWRALSGRLPLEEVEVAETRDARCAVRGD